MNRTATLSRWKPWQIDAGAVAAIAALAALVYWVEVSASLDRYDAAIATAGEFESRQVKKRDIDNSIVVVRRQAEAAAKSLADAGFTLDSAGRVNQRLARLTELAATAGLQVEAIEPSAATASGHLAAISIRLRARGGYASVAKFIHQVRDRLPDCVIASMDLSAAPAIHEPPANVNIQISWYARPDNAVASN